MTSKPASGSGLTATRALVVILILIILGAYFTMGTMMEMRSVNERLEGLMTAQAQSIAGVILESTAHNVDAYRRWEDELTRRLYDTALWVARQDSVRAMTRNDVHQLAIAHHVNRINLFDKQGTRVVTSALHPEEGLSPRHDPKDYILPILEGRTDSLRIGFKPSRYHEGTRFAVAVARPRGGAVVVSILADSLKTILEGGSARHLLESIHAGGGVKYIALQNEDGIVAASDSSIVFPPLHDDPLLRDLPADGSLATREIPSIVPGGVFEASRGIVLPGVGRAILRVGLDPTPLHTAHALYRRQMLLRSAVLLAAIALCSGLLLYWQRREVLNREVRETTARLEVRNEETRRNEKLAAMVALASSVAHEIRNPLNTISMTAQQIARDPGIGEDLRAQAQGIRSEGQRIEAIVLQFLQFAQPREPRTDMLDVAETVQSVADTIRPSFVAAGVGLDVETAPAAAELDSDFLKQVVDNLLRNAMEASPPDGWVKVRVRRSGPDVEIVVEDQGPGVPPELRERIFDLYFSTKASGSGVGLSLASQLAAAMGGGVRLDDNAEGGARFIAHFPAGKARS